MIQRQPRSRSLASRTAKPETETEWLMQPFEYGKPQSEQLLDQVARLVDGLDEVSRECIEAIHFERRSYSQLAERLGCSKPHAWRLTRRAEERMRAQLVNITEIREKYT